jgi:serine/threonine-protein phosphatase 5
VCAGGCVVEKDYAGPRLDEEDGKYKISLEFVQAMVAWFKEGKTLPKRYVWEIVLSAYEHFSREPSLVDVPVPEGTTLDVIGDVHGASVQRAPCGGVGAHRTTGQFYDVLHLFSLTGQPSEKHILLMNGDLVDRGSWSIEVILLAFAYKCKFGLAPCYALGS